MTRYYVCGDGWTIHNAEAAAQCVEIKDAPRFQYRGAMIDVARNFQSKQTVLKKSVGKPMLFFDAKNL